MAYVGNSGRVWRKVPESDARSVPQHITLIQNASFTVRSMTRDWSKRIYVSAATIGHDSVTWQRTWHAARAVWSSITISTLKDTSLVQKVSMSQPATPRYLLRSLSQTARYLLRSLSQTARYLLRSLSQTARYLLRSLSQTARYLVRSLSQTARYLVRSLHRLQQLGTYLDPCHSQQQLGTCLHTCHRLQQLST